MKISAVLIAIMPAVAFAQEKDLNYLIRLTIGYLNSGVYVIIALAIFMFVWNVVKYFIISGDDVGAKKEAGLYVMWSVIGFFVIISILGLVKIVQNTFKLDSTAPSGFFGNFRSSGDSGYDRLPGSYNSPDTEMNAYDRLPGSFNP